MIDPNLLNELIKDEYITVQSHPEWDLKIYNYTNKTQYEKKWNDLTLLTRGLILDSNYNIVAYPLRKFFNIEEIEENGIIPDEPFDIYEKLDGSLGILYWYNNRPHIASRGSFTSEQAIQANKILYEKYAETVPKLNPNYTYLFEIIYPENQIVVNYGNVRKLVLIAIFQTKTGIEIPLPNKLFNLDIVNKINNKNLNLNTLKLKQKDTKFKNKEGFVLKYQSGFRVKIKYEEYVKRHKLRSDLSNKLIWEILSTKGYDHLVNEYINDLPDEIFDRLYGTATDFLLKFDTIYNEITTAYKHFDSRKEAAEYFKTQQYPHLMFNLLDNKDPSYNIWKLIKPKTYKRI